MLTCQIAPISPTPSTLLRPPAPGDGARSIRASSFLPESCIGATTLVAWPAHAGSLNAFRPRASRRRLRPQRDVLVGFLRRAPVPGELLFRVTTGHVALL